MNWGPLSQRIRVGARPRRSTICSSALTASSAPVLRAAGVASASLVCSSVTLRILSGRPSAVRSLTKTDRPHLVGADGGQLAGHARPRPAFPRLRGEPQPFIAPQPLHPLAVTRPALPAQD